MESIYRSNAEEGDQRRNEKVRRSIHGDPTNHHQFLLIYDREMLIDGSFLSIKAVVCPRNVTIQITVHKGKSPIFGRFPRERLIFIIHCVSIIGIR